MNIRSSNRKAEQATLIDKATFVPSASEVPLTQRVASPGEETVSMIQHTPSLSENTLQTEVGLFDDDESFTQHIVKKGRRSHGKRVRDLIC